MSPCTQFINFRASFQFKLFLIFTLLTALMAVLFGSAYIVTEIREQSIYAGNRCQLIAAHLADTVRLPLFAENRTVLMQIAQDTARTPDFHSLTVRTNDGRVLAEMRKPVSRSPSELLSRTVEVRSTPLGSSPESAIIGSKEPVGALIGTVRLDLDTTEFKARTQRLIMMACATAFLFWISVSSLCYLALRQVTRSFNALMRGLESMQTGNYAVRIAPVSNDEPGRAAGAISLLAASLQEREEENRRLQQQLINAMRLEVQKEKQQIMAKLIQTNRMTSLGLLASSMAHEINTPNGAIKLAGQQVAKTWKSALPILERVAEEEGDFVLGGAVFSLVRGEVTKATEVIARCSERIEKVVQDMRAYNVGGHSDAKDRVNLNQVVVDALTIIRAHGRHGNIVIQNEPYPELPAVTGNRYQLEQVVINLILNSIQAIPESRNGVVTIVSDYDSLHGEVSLVVRDDGKGIRPDIMSRLMEPFFSTRMESGGSGLGLYISNFIVTEHRGRLVFESEPDKGTTATISIPAADNGGTAGPDAPPVPEVV
ncbi:sensor histidine kinase [Oryzomonas japonica]|nr:ATP-binding protein [Oryzomonas japonica]